MANRKLLIIWKWGHLEQSNLNYSVASVEKGEDFVISIHENKLEFNKDLWIENFCSKELSHLDEVVLLCHTPDEKGRFNVLHLLNQSKCRKVYPLYFGGGKDYIYYSKETGTGLIDQTGSFQDDHIRDLGDCTIFKDGKISYTSFNDVWNYYSLNKYKEPIYTYLREKLLLEMFGTEFNAPIRSWLEQQPDDAKTRINEFVLGNHPVFQENKAVINDWQDLLQARQDLIQLLNKPAPNALEIRKVTETLLKNIAGPIY